MPKIVCRCGTNINLSIIPAPDGFVMIQEADFDQIRDDLASLHGRNLTQTDFKRQAYSEILGSQNKRIIEAYICPGCGRLWLFAPMGANSPAVVYVVEQGNPQNLLG